MIVFGSHPIKQNTIEVIHNLRVTAEAIYESTYDHNKIVKLLIDYGEFETAVLDHFNSSDEAYNLRILLRTAGKLTGDLFRKSLNKDFNIIASNKEFLKVLKQIESFTLPEEITTKIPEGYAYYGVYPEMYYEASKQFYSDLKPKKCIIIGIRSIGTSLSSVIWSSLEEHNVITYSTTVRPYGEPFDRKVSLEKSFMEIVLLNRDSYFLIVDEGPGLSGSSFAAAADALHKAGIDTRNIFLFPSRMSTGDDLISQTAKTYWKTLDKRYVAFDDYWLQSGRFRELTGGYNYEEISAGLWREIFIKDESKFPPVFEQFERRKFLLKDDNGEVRYFVKFCGLGKYGEQVFNNSVKFAEAGFSPQVYKYDQGFIFYEYINKLNGNHFDVNKLMSFVRDYLLFIKKELPAEPSYTYEEMKDMIFHNTKELFDQPFIDKLMKLEFDKNMFTSAVMNDGRMFPHEWIFNERYLKTDNTEHYFDHLFPGAQDISWDIAAFFIEFNLPGEHRKEFIESFSSLSGDNHLIKKLNFVMIEYLAFRLGYSAFAANNSSSKSDKHRFTMMVKRYSDLLRNEAALQS